MEDKVLCCCFNVTLKEVEEHISNGVSTFEELQSLTKIGTECPPCKENNSKLFSELVQKKDRI